ncbi:hypothetical protein PVK06_017528 [Gossypium arboreum]|uniref:Reverse transcriptase zinc-binding domain-containing protein n=1 Tax=Gossypium arboreum TaxID=29729 RepID=A0ABR0Q3E7_GOSAR|nr:hypothetical protein PVK06_017528 [Gossypium arboreum]
MVSTKTLDSRSRIISSGIPYLDGGLDKISWLPNSTRTFSIRNAYRSIKENQWNTKEAKSKSPWIFNGAQRVHFFLWLIFKQHLLTNLERVRIAKMAYANVMGVNVMTTTPMELLENIVKDKA